MIKGKLISLETYSRERCHKMYKNYKSDLMMTEDEYIYDENKVDKYYEMKVKDETRRFFAIIQNEKVIGEIQLKYINFEEKFATLSIVLMNDSVKNKGYGTEAEKLVLDYAKNELNLETVYADAVKRNVRSKHILEKIGFQYTHSDEILDYFQYKL